MYNTYFDAAKRTLVNSRFDGTANVPFDVIASSERNIARERARWISANSSLMKNIDGTIVNNSIGRGLVLNAISSNQDFNKEIEELWEEFNIEALDYYGEMDGTNYQRTLLYQRMVDGGLFVKVTRPTNHKFPFSLQMIEVDNLSETYTYKVTNGFVADGLIFDRKGKVQGYRFRLYKNPFWNNNYFSGKMMPKTVKNDGNIIFFRRKDGNRSSQRREFTEYAPIVNDMKHFMAFQSATTEAASARSKLVYAIEKEGGIGGMGTAADGRKVEYLQGIYTKYLDAGEKLHLVDPQVAGTKYDEFHRNTTRQLAIGREVSYELATRDASSANFSSIRASIIQDHKLFDFNQMQMVNQFLKPIYKKFVREMVFSGRVKTLKADDYVLSERDYQKAQWIAPARSWVDPYKDIKALELKYNLGVMTLGDIAKSEGKDIADIIAERVKEKEMMQKAGLLQEGDLQK